jgi:ABC-2 type transport system ATP-binding protein
MVALTLEHATKHFRDVVAVDDLSFEVAEGTVTGFLGPNGAGKSTTLRMLLGLVHPTSGRALVTGVPYRSLPHPLRTVGAALEASGFHPRRRAVDHLRVVASTAGIPETRIAQVLNDVDLTVAAGRRVGGFSLGMRQRLALATALLGDPEILVADEPTNGLDPQGREEMLALIRDIATRRGMSLILCSHLLHDVERVCDQVIVLNQGQIARQGEMRELTGARRQVFDVRFKGDAAAVLTDLKDLGADWREGDDGVRLFLPEGQGPETVFRVAMECGVQVRHLRPGAETLEDVFLRALGHEIQD